MEPELAVDAQAHAVDFLHGHHLSLQVPLGSFQRVIDGSVYRQTRVLATPSGATQPPLPETRSGDAASPAKLLRKTLRTAGRPARPASGARARPVVAPRRSILLSQAMALMRVEPADIAAVLARLATAKLYLGEPPAPGDRIGIMAIETARILARSTAGFKLIVALCGPAMAGQAKPQLAAVRMKLQAQAALAGQADPDQARCARLALDAATARLATGEMTSAQQVAWFDWTQHQRGRQPEILRNMQGTLHKFSTKTIHRHGPRDSVRNSLMRLSGKRLGPLRAATLADATGMVEWQGEKTATDSDAMRRIVRSIVSNLKHVSSVRMADGHVYGVSTKQLSKAVATAVALSGTPLSAQVDLQASKARESFVEISRGQDGIRLFIGTCRKLSGHVTIDATLGYEVTLPGLQAKASAGIALTPLSCEIAEPSGLVFRVARRMRPDGTDFDDATMYRKALVLVDHLFAAVPRADRASPEATWKRLATAFHDEPDLSAGWISRKSTASSASVGASVRLTANAMQCVVGPQLSAKATRQLGSADSHVESGRRIAQERRATKGHRFDLSASLGIHAKHQATEMPDALSGGTSLGAHARSAALTLCALELPLSSSTSDHMQGGTMKLIEEDGELLAAVSTFEVEYKSLYDWDDAIRSDSTGWIGAFAQSPCEAGLEASAIRLNDFLAFVERNQRPSDSYILRYRLRDDVAARINLGNAFAQGLNDNDDKASLRHIEAAKQSLLGDPRSWVEAELKVRQFASESRGAGFDLGAKLQRRKTLASEKDWSRLKPSPAVQRTRAQSARRLT